MRAKKLILFLTVLLLLVLVAACTTKMVTVSFYADGTLCREVRVEKGKKIDYDEIPAVPEKPGYKGVWADAALDDAVDADLRIDAVYTVNSYTVTFRADGKVVATRTVTMGKTVADVPAVPEKAGFTGAWSISSESFASLNSDTVVDAVYTRNAVTVTFYKNSFTYNVARVTAGDNVEPNTYYVFTDDYVLTEDTVFVEGKSYFTRTRDYFAVMDAEDGVVVGNVPDPPAQDGYSVKWMKINSTPTGDILTTPDFNNVTESISVVAYPFITISLVDSFTGRSSSVAYDIEETVQSVRPLSATLTDYEFYSWYLDEDLKTPASFPCLFTRNTTLYAKWIGTRATDGVVITGGKVVGYNGSATEVYIPMKYSEGEETAYVTGISASAFKYTPVVSVSIPATVTEIADSAFYGCASLQSVIFPDGNYVRTYGENAFRGCSALRNFGFSEKTERIGGYAFYGCSALQTVTGLENSALDKAERFVFSGCSYVTALSLPRIKVIEERAFSGMTAAAITFTDPSSIERVGSFAFENCKKFSGFLSANLREIGESVFSGCPSLTSVTVFGTYKTPALFGKTAPATEDAASYYSVTIGADTYYIPKALYSVLIIPTQTGTVLTDVLYDCYTVKSVQFAGNVKTISSYAFRLEHYTPSAAPFNVTLPSSLETIEGSAFLTRNDLTAIELPATLKEIGERAFYGIPSLRSVTIDAHDALESVGRDAFTATPWYNTYTGVIALGKVVLGISEEYCRKATYYEISADKFRSYSVIAPYAFAGNTVLQKITLSDTISQIGDNAFAGCTALRTFAFKQYVSTSSRKLGTTVLDGCNSLFDLTLCEDIDIDLLFASGVPASLRTLRIDNSSRSDAIVATNENGFSASSLVTASVTSLYIGAGFKEIGEGAFENVTSLNYLSVAESITTIDASAFAGCDALTEATGLAGLSVIEENAFDGCSTLVSFAFPSVLTKIGDNAFRGCAFVSFAAPAALSSIGESAFDGCASLKEVALSSSVVSIGDRAFRGCDISSLDIPGSVVFLADENEFVGEEMLAGNNSFKSLTLSAGVTAARLFGNTVPTMFAGVTVKNCALADDQFNGLSTIRSAALENVTAIGDRAFYGCELLQHIVIPPTVTSIGESAFEGCSSLNSCQIDTAGTVLTEVKQKAFKNCTALRFVIFPETITSGDWTELFYGCDALTSTNVPSAVKEIGEYAYYGCEKLVALRMHNDVETIGAYAFKNCYMTELDNVSFENLTYLGEGAFENCSKLGNIRAENAEFIGENVYKNCSSLTELTVGENPVSYYAGTEILSRLTVINVASYVGNIDVDAYLTGCDNVSSVVVYTASTSFPTRSFAEKVNAITGNKAITFLSVPLYRSLSPLVDNVYSKPSQMAFDFAYNEQDLTASIVGITGSIEKYVYLPDSTTKNGVEYAVTSIGGSAFVNSVFDYVVIPSTIVEIGNAAFAKSTLKTVVFESGSKCHTIGENAFKESALTAISVPSSVEVIGGSAFDNCTALARVTFFAGSNLNFIGDNAFNMTTSLTSVTFTGPISYVGSSAFSGSSVNYVDFGVLASFTAVNNYTFASSQISTVYLPDTVLRIEEGAFSGFAGEAFTCPGDLTYIGAKAFYKANALKSVIFPDHLEFIGSEAFYGNTELIEIHLPDSVGAVGASAFYGCEKVATLTLGESLESVGTNAFGGLLLLSQIDYNARLIADFLPNNGVFASCGISGTGIRVVFGDKVTRIPDNLFYASTSGDKTPRVSNVSFSGTPSVESIGSNAFRGGNYLGVIVLPATVLSIGSGAFVGCENVTLYSESAKAGLDWSASYKDNDKGVVFGRNNVTVNGYSFVAYDDGVIVTNYTGDPDVVVPVSLGGKPVLGTGVTFEGRDVTFIVLPETVTLPGSFNGCSSLIGITMEEGPLAIAAKAFYDCSSLLYFNVPSSVVSIGLDAFTGCDALGTVYVSGAEIVERLTTERLSQTCGGLFASAQSVYISTALNVNLPTVLQVSGSTARTYNKVLSDKDGYAVWSTLYWRSSSAVSASYVYLLNDWTPDSSHEDIVHRYNLYVEGIGAMKEYSSAELIPWKDYSDLVNSITIGRNITSLGRYSFSRMKNLSAVYFLAEECAGSDAPKYIFNSEENPSGDGFELVVGSNVTTVPSYLFYGNRYLRSIVWESNKVKTIESSAFENCTGLAVVDIPNCVTTIGARAFYGCSKVASLTIGQGVKTFGSAAFGNFGADENGFYLTTIYYNALSAVNELSDVFTSSYKLGTGDTGTELVVNRAVTSVPDYIFSGFDRLVQITFNGESSVRTIGKYAFENCTNLRSVNIPLAVTSIGQYAFSGCSALASVGFADSNRISFIGEKAFDETDYFNTAANWVENVLYMNDRKFLLEARLSVSEDYAVLEGTDIIAEKAFAGVTTIRYITVPSSVDIICADAFDGCAGLKTVFLVSAPVIAGLSAQESQGSLCRYATVVYCRSDLMKNGRTKAGEYLEESFNLAETDTMKGTNQYYSYTKLYWQCAKPETTSNVYTYLLNDFSRPGYYRMEVAGVGEMCDFTARSAPWYSFESTDYSGLVTTLTFGKGVTSVGSYAFRAFSVLNKINYNNSDGLVSIGESAFAVCSALTVIEICKTVTSIGDYAFSACGAVTRIVYNAVACADFVANNGVFTGVGAEGDGLILEIDNEVTRVPAYLCCPGGSATNAPKLTEIKFFGGAGNRCASVGDYAFAYCEQVAALTMDGNSLLSIGEYAFYSCKSIGTLSIPSKVENIEYNAFGLCTGITQITLRAADCTVAENGVFNLVGSETDGTVVSFTDTVRAVPERFLFNAEDLHNGPKVVTVYFPEDDQSRLERIGSLAFGYCTLIKTLTLPKTLNSISEGAFYGCTSLKTFVTPFVGGVAKALAPSSETLFGYVFHYDTEDVNDDHAGMSMIDQSHNGIDRLHFYVPDSIQYVTVTHYTNIYYGAFQNCDKIVSVTTELSEVGSIVNETETASVNNGYLVGAYAFKNCTALSSVSFADVLTDIGESAFIDCINLTQITIPVHVERIGSLAFANTQKLRDINFNAENCADFKEDDDVFLDAGIMQSGITLTIGNAVRRLPAYFCKTSTESQIKEVKMVNAAFSTLTEIGRHAFYECKKLTALTLPGTVTSIGQDAFYDTGYYNTASNWRECALYYVNSAYKYLLAFNDETAQSVYVVLDDTLVIADAAFAQSTVLTEITMPMSVVTVGSDAFLNCQKLQTVTFRVNDATKLSALTTIGAGAFKNCNALYSIRITGNVVNIGDQAFDGCRSLKFVYIDSETISSMVTTESAAGYLCNYADNIYVQKDISSEKTGTYIRTRYTSSQGDIEDDYRKWTKK